MITIENHGPLLLASNFWGSPWERAGDFVLSYSAGCFRLLVPQSRQAIVSALASVTKVFITRGQLDGEDTFELLFSDSTKTPLIIHISADRCVPLPDNSLVAGEVMFAAYTEPRRSSKPHQARERPAWYSIAE
jgi:hypothetical protein